jgi:mono/diheme cytochrome c family protein
MTRSLTLMLLALLALGAPASAQDQVEEGRRAFMRNGCHGCHTVGTMGTPMATDLTHVGAKYRPEYLRRWLRDPSYLRPSAHMPTLELTEADIRALAAFLSAQQ